MQTFNSIILREFRGQYIYFIFNQALRILQYQSVFLVVLGKSEHTKYPMEISILFQKSQVKLIPEYA